MRKWMLLLALLLTGCGTTGTQLEGTTPETAVSQRVDTEVQGGWSPLAFQYSRVDELQGFEPVIGVAWLEGGRYRFGPPENLDGRRGYWLFSEHPTRLGYEGTDDGRTPERPVEAGWNLVSFACIYPVRTADVTPHDILLYEVAPDGSSRAVDTLTPGRPCWVYSPRPATLRWTLPLQQLKLTPERTVVRLLGAQQLELKAFLEDGSTANVTDLATWTSETPAIAGISPNGVTTGLHKGTTEITATFQGQTVRAAVNVIDPSEGGPGGGASAPIAPPPPAASPSPSPSPSPTIERRSVSSAGVQGNAESYEPATSTDARYVTFASDATNLVAGDTNGAADIFRHDRVTGTTIRVSVSAAGDERLAPAEEDRPTADISGDGRYVVFDSRSANLVPGDTNDSTDIFVKDCDTGALARLAPQADSDSLNPALSSDGAWVAFRSYATNLVSGDDSESEDVFLANRTTGAITAVTLQSNADSYSPPHLSADGAVCVFSSSATNLVAGDTNLESDIFAWSGGSLERLGGNGGSYNPRVSPDGRYVAFESDASDLVAGDTNGQRDVFLYDRTTATCTRIVENATRPSWSPDGRYVAFEQGVYDRTTATIATIPSGERPVLANGWVSFLSAATDLVTGDTNGVNDVFAAPFP